jgi:hypothetical protein
MKKTRNSGVVLGLRRFPCVGCGRSTIAKTFHGRYCEECRLFNSVVAKAVFGSYRYVFWREPEF